MTGFFAPDGEPALSVHVSGPVGNLDVDAVIGTAFNGDLALPPDQIDALGLPEATVTEVAFADGRVREVPLYDAKAQLSGVSREVFVAEAPTMPLVGTGFLQGFSLHIEFQAEGTIRVEPLGSSS